MSVDRRTLSRIAGWLCRLAGAALIAYGFAALFRGDWSDGATADLAIRGALAFVMTGVALLMLPRIVRLFLDDRDMPSAGLRPRGGSGDYLSQRMAARRGRVSAARRERARRLAKATEKNEDASG